MILLFTLVPPILVWYERNLYDKGCMEKKEPADPMQKPEAKLEESNSLDQCLSCLKICKWIIIAYLFFSTLIELINL